VASTTCRRGGEGQQEHSGPWDALDVVLECSALFTYNFETVLLAGRVGWKHRGTQWRMAPRRKTSAK